MFDVSGGGTIECFGGRSPPYVAATLRLAKEQLLFIPPQQGGHGGTSFDRWVYYNRYVHRGRGWRGAL